MVYDGKPAEEQLCSWTWPIIFLCLMIWRVFGVFFALVLFVFSSVVDCRHSGSNLSTLWLTAMQDIYVRVPSGARCVVKPQMYCTELCYLYTCFIAGGLFHQLTREKSVFCLLCSIVKTKGSERGLIDVQSGKSLQRLFSLAFVTLLVQLSAILHPICCPPYSVPIPL